MKYDCAKPHSDGDLHHAGGDDSNVEIVNCNPDVKKILSIASFEQLFQIH